MEEASTLQLVEFMEEVERKVTRQVDSSGTLRIRTTLRTPKGDLSETFIIPQGLPACWEENFVKPEKEVESAKLCISVRLPAVKGIQDGIRVFLHCQSFCRWMRFLPGISSRPWADALCARSLFDPRPLSQIHDAAGAFSLR